MLVMCIKETGSLLNQKVYESLDGIVRDENGEAILVTPENFIEVYENENGISCDMNGSVLLLIPTEEWKAVNQPIPEPVLYVPTLEEKVDALQKAFDEIALGGL